MLLQSYRESVAQTVWTIKWGAYLLHVSIGQDKRIRRLASVNAEGGCRDFPRKVIVRPIP